MPVVTRALSSSAFLLALVYGCGGATPSGVGISHGRPREIPVELALRTTSGEHVDVADQRGSPCLLFVVTTYDGVSQAAIREVAYFARTHLDTVVLAIIAQPDAETFAELYESTFEPPFTVTYEDGDTVQRGTSDLGAFDAVPAFYMLDAHGLLVADHVGWVSAERLLAMYDQAARRGGIERESAAPGEDAGALHE